eukprot:4533670-Pyramimonas_sp.AAC.2
MVVSLLMTVGPARTRRGTHRGRFTPQEGRFTVERADLQVCGPLEVLAPEWEELVFSLAPMRLSAERHFHRELLPRWEVKSPCRAANPPCRAANSPCATSTASCCRAGRRACAS